MAPKKCRRAIWAPAGANSAGKQRTRTQWGVVGFARLSSLADVLFSGEVGGGVFMSFLPLHTEPLDDCCQKEILAKRAGES